MIKKKKQPPNLDKILNEIEEYKEIIYSDLQRKCIFKSINMCLKGSVINSKIMPYIMDFSELLSRIPKRLFNIIPLKE